MADARFVATLREVGGSPLWRLEEPVLVSPDATSAPDPHSSSAKREGWRRASGKY